MSPVRLVAPLGEFTVLLQSPRPPNWWGGGANFLTKTIPFGAQTVPPKHIPLDPLVSSDEFAV